MGIYFLFIMSNIGEEKLQGILRLRVSEYLSL